MKEDIKEIMINIEDEYKIRIVDLFMDIENMVFECKKLIVSHIDHNIWEGKLDSVSILCNKLKEQGYSIIDIKIILNNWGLDVLGKILKTKEN